MGPGAPPVPTSVRKGGMGQDSACPRSGLPAHRTVGETLEQETDGLVSTDAPTPGTGPEEIFLTERHLHSMRVR